MKDSQFGACFLADPVIQSHTFPPEPADVAQSVERILGKDEVTGSNPVCSSFFMSIYEDETCFALVRCEEKMINKIGINC